MKIIALLPFKNEEWILPTYISDLSGIVDQIIGIDDGSTDKSVQILEEAGALVFKNENTIKTGWAEHNIRQKLLQLGRQHGGTHFVCLDADEIFNLDFRRKAREIISSLSPGQAVSMKWTTLWKSLYTERIDSVYKNLYKDFIFCDDTQLEYPYAFLGVKRTPSKESHTIKVDGGNSVFHFQYVNFQKNQLKQAWYMCSELVKGERSVKRINLTYAITLDGKHVKTQAVDQNQYASILLPKEQLIDSENWHLCEIKRMFNEHGISFFEPLNIWGIKQLQNIFLETFQRKPKIKTFSKTLVYANKTRHLVKDVLKSIFKKVYEKNS